MKKSFHYSEKTTLPEGVALKSKTLHLDLPDAPCK